MARRKPRANHFPPASESFLITSMARPRARIARASPLCQTEEPKWERTGVSTLPERDPGEEEKGVRNGSEEGWEGREN
jgi:hypothetical protein